MFERDKMQPDDGGATSAFLGKGSKITGKISLDGPGRIEGQVEGEITAQDTLTVGDGAILNATVNGTSIVVHGRITGDINARARLELKAGSKVFGNVKAPSLIIQEGAAFEGQCSMGATEGQRPEKERKPNAKDTEAAAPKPQQPSPTH